MSESSEREVPLALMVQTPDEPGALHALTRVFLDHEANITHVDIAERREGLSQSTSSSRTSPAKPRTCS